MAATPKYRKHSLVFLDPSLTQQQHKDDVDINVIMRRFAAGQSPQGMSGQPVFQDLSQIPSYHDMLNTVVRVEQEFNSLPASMRERFGNDPQMLMDFLADEKNRSEAIDMGLVLPPMAAPEPESGSWEAPPQGQPAKPAKTAPKAPRSASEGEADS